MYAYEPVVIDFLSHMGDRIELLGVFYDIVCHDTKDCDMDYPPFTATFRGLASITAQHVEEFLAQYVHQTKAPLFPHMLMAPFSVTVHANY